MTERDWRFLLDENIEPQVGSFLTAEGYRADHVQDVLSKGAEDIEDVLPYARENDLIVITGDISDFEPLSHDEHRGVLLVYNRRVSAYDVATAVFRIVEAYGDREQLTTDAVDEWL